MKHCTSVDTRVFLLLLIRTFKDFFAEKVATIRQAIEKEDKDSVKDKDKDKDKDISTKI